MTRPTVTPATPAQSAPLPRQPLLCSSCWSGGTDQRDRARIRATRRIPLLADIHHLHAPIGWVCRIGGIQRPRRAEARDFQAAAVDAVVTDQFVAHGLG